MDVLWQDNVASFLDGSSLGFAGSLGDVGASSLGDVGAPWFASADGGEFSGQSVLWWDNGGDTTSGASSLTGVDRFDSGDASTDAWLSNGATAFSGGGSTLDGGLLWPQAGSTSNSLLASGGAGQFDLSGVEGASAKWLPLINALAGRSEPWLAEVTSLLWTNGSGSGLAPPVISSLLPNSFTGANAATFAPEQLVWTPPSGAPSLTGGPGLADAPVTLASSLGGPVESSSGLPTSLGSTR